MIKAVQVVGPQERAIERRAKKGGSAMGAAVGAVAGGAIGSFAPGVGTAAGALAGASAGSSLGGQIGNAIDPARQGSTSIERRAEAGVPQLQQSDKSEQLKQSILALQSQPPNLQKEYAPVLVDAYMTSVAQANPKQGGMA
jgi:uncharacterized protein YcfJ